MMETTQSAPRILIVDDDKEIAKGFTTLLSEEGFEAYAEYNGKAALATLQENDFDMILVDGLLPGMDGFALCEQIRQMPGGRSCKLVMISGVYRASKHAAEATGKYGLSDYLEKPIAPMTILKLLRKEFGRAYPKKNGASSLFTEINDYFLLNGKALPLVGKLAAAPLPVVLGQIWARKLTGVLMVTHGKAKKLISIDTGRPVAVSSNIISETLGRLLLNDGMIDEAVYKTTLEVVRRTRQKHGEVLIQTGAVSSLELSEALKKQFRTKLFGTFAWLDGDYAFQAYKELPPYTATSDMRGPKLIRDGIAENVSEERIAAWLKPYKTSLVYATTQHQQLMQSAGYQLRDTRFIRELSGNEMVSEILDTSFKTRAQMLKFFFTMIVIGAVHLDPPEPELNPELLKADNVAAKKESVVVSVAQQHLEHSSNDDSGSIMIDRDASSIEQIEKIEHERIMTILEGEERDYYDKIYHQREKMREQNYFEMLNVERTTKPDEVKKIFLRFARSWHPDTIPYPDRKEIRQVADEIFTMLSKANEVLTNRNKRADYIDFLSGGGNEDATEEVAKILAAEQHFSDGKAAIRRKDWEQAKRYFDEAIALNPNEGEFFAEKGWAYYNLNPNDMVARQEALAILEKAAKMAPKHADTHFYRGQIHKQAGQLLDAAEAFLEAIKIDKNHTRARSEVRLMKMRKKQAEEDRKKKKIFSFIKK